jgi:hypothetical protein
MKAKLQEKYFPSDSMTRIANNLSIQNKAAFQL